MPAGGVIHMGPPLLQGGEHLACSPTCNTLAHEVQAVLSISYLLPSGALHAAVSLQASRVLHSTCAPAEYKSCRWGLEHAAPADWGLPNEVELECHISVRRVV